MTPFIHPTATVADNVTLGEETRIGANCVLHPHTRIGDRCRIEANTEIGPWAYLGDNIQVGERVRIHSGSEIEDDVCIDNECEIGRHEEKSDRETTRLHKTLIRSGQHIKKATRNQEAGEEKKNETTKHLQSIQYDNLR